jgi:TonB-linked SusC/RagA family outer membrane protein
MPIRSFTKLLRIMRLTAFFLLVCCLQVSARGWSQRVTFSGRDVPLPAVFTAIREQTHYFIVYDPAMLQAARPVTVQAQDLPVDDFLQQVFAHQPLTYSITRSTIFIRQRKLPATPAPPAAAPPVKGVVRGPDGEPLAGVSVVVKGTQQGTQTDSDGNFSIVAEPGAILLISSIGFETIERKVTGSDVMIIKVSRSDTSMQEVSVVSTGYQQLPKERATGSFLQVDNELLNRKVSTTILDRLDGITPGILFNNSSAITPGDPLGRSLGIFIRGQSTLSYNVSTDPLIVVDNFPYEGDLRNINPNDIESVTILKDAAAASIWGAKAGNGVIVITTKKGKLNQPMRVEVNASVTIGNKPDIYYDRDFLPSSEYIDVETILFNNGYFNADITNTSNRPPLSPVVDILTKQRDGLLTDSEAAGQLNALRQFDVRNDFNAYVYRRAVSQQYSVGLRGGTPHLTYALSIGHDDNRFSQRGNAFERTSINSLSVYTPVKNLEVTTALNYSRSTTRLNTEVLYGALRVGGKYNGLYPYAQLADADGHPLPIVKDYRAAYLDSTEKLGFLDWRYRPLDEIANGDNTSKVSDLLLRVGAKYRFLRVLNAEIIYQNETQSNELRNYRNASSYYARNLINQFSQYDPLARTFTYNLPKGGILQNRNFIWATNNLRGQLNYEQTVGDHSINAILGTEIREIKITGTTSNSFGYDDEFGTANNILNFNTFYPTNPTGFNALAYALQVSDGAVIGRLNRFVSYYANAAYSFKNTYTLSVSARKDGANLFGVKTNDKVVPLWSAGLGYEISRASFYSIDWLPYLKTRLTYGFNGNVYNGSAYLTGVYSVIDMTGAPVVYITNAPNPELRWERIRNINWGIDFTSKNNRLNGTIDLYQKTGLDLLEPAPLAPSTGFLSYTGNAAKTRTAGIDLSLTSKNVGGQFSWYTTLLFSTLRDKVLKYDPKRTASSVQTRTGNNAWEGKPILAVFGYRWAGLDPANGDPQGFLNGKVSKDYGAIINNYDADSLVYKGSAMPTVFGAFRNDFSWKGFSLSVNVTYKLGYYFRRSSMSLNYQDLIGLYGNADYSRRWQKPGDEAITNVPSAVYPANVSRDKFYRYSEALVEKGDHIRLQDIRLSYDLTRKVWKRSPFSGFQVYGYAGNLGIIWRANDYHIDPDNYSWYGQHTLPNTFSMALGVRAAF